MIVLRLYSVENIDPELKMWVMGIIMHEYSKFDSSHGPDHAKDVIARGLAFLKEYESTKNIFLNTNIVFTSCALHDIGLLKDRDNHEAESGHLVRGLYKKSLLLWFTPEEIEIIAKAVEDHRASNPSMPRNIYGLIVSLADRNDPKDLYELLLRGIKYTNFHQPDLSDEELALTVATYMIKKYGPTGYANRLFLDVPSARKKTEEISGWLKNSYVVYKLALAIVRSYRKTIGIQKLRERDFSKSDIVKGVLGLGAGAALLGSIKKGHLTGSVKRYHNTRIEDAPKILEEGLKTSYSVDPKNLTNLSLPEISMDKKKGLIYTSKDKEMVSYVGANRALKLGKFGGPGKVSLMTPELKEKYLEEVKNPKFSKTLELDLDYDSIKGKRILNPELNGATSPEDLWIRRKELGKGHILSPQLAKEVWKDLNEKTHIIDKDISPEHIKESPHYKKRGIKEITQYAKNNPGRFGLETGKVAGGLAALGYGVHKLMKLKK